MAKYTDPNKPLLSGPTKLTALRIPEPLLKEMKKLAKQKKITFSKLALHAFNDYTTWELRQTKK